MCCISAVVLLSCTAMSATCGAQEKGLSGDQVPTDNGALVIHPVNHATFLMQWNGKTVYVDPVGGASPSPIRQFKPKVVYPYHYRSGDGTKADFGQLKKLVGEDSGTEIRVRDWYPEK